MSDFPDAIAGLFKYEDVDRSTEVEEIDDDGYDEGGDVDDPVPAVGGDYTPEVKTPPASTETDRAIQQRDAIIREKSQLVRERRERDEQIRTLREELNKIKGGAVEPKVEKPVAPDPKKDPVGYLEFKRKEELGLVTNTVTELKNEIANLQREQQTKELIRNISADEDNFRRTTPDYDAAVKFLDVTVYDWFVQNGCTEEEAAECLNTFKADLFNKAVSLRMPVASTFYQHALQVGHKRQDGRSAGRGRIGAAKRGSDAGSLSTVGRSSSGSDDQRVTVEQYRNMHQFDPIRLRIANDNNLFRDLLERGSCDLPTD